MQYFMMFLVLSTSLMLSGCSKKRVESIEYLPTPGETVTHVFSNQDSEPTRFFIEIFPKEIYFGDTIYFVIYHENIFTEAVMVRDHKDFSLYKYLHYLTKPILSSTEIQKEYRWISELPSRNHGSIVIPKRELQTGENYPDQKTCLEFPPLEDWNDPFWKELREKIPPEGINCKLHFQHEYYSPGLQDIPRIMVIDQDIQIKPRPANEMSLLNKWYKNTPVKLFPQDDGDRKVPHNDDYGLKSSGRSNIKIGWNSYDPWLFIRLGNRKPSDPNNPTTLDGWRKLEASLIPSTMRDEVRLTRLQLEYYSAKKGEASDNAKEELREWLKSLPEVQRTIMTTFLVSKMYDFKRTSLCDKHRELMRALYDMLDHGCQEAVCNFESINYKDRTLPPPAGVKIQRSMNEILEPTVEDLAHGSKELPDGFRLWDAVGDVGPVRMVAQFVELKEDKDMLVVKHRDGRNINLIFSKLSEEDKQYARELSERLSEEGQ